MFYAKVLIGNARNLEQSLNYLKTPNDGNSTGIVYDSIINSKMVVVYANKKAYPEYLITYN